MKLPSLQYIYQEASESFKRFPLTLLIAFMGCLCMIYLIETANNAEDYPQVVHFILICSLGISITFSAQMLIEKQGFKTPTNYLIYAATLLVLAVYYFTFPNHLNDFLTYMRYFLLCLAAHFLVAFIPFTSKGEVNGFWQYNKSLFIRFLTAVLFSFVLLLGIFFAFFCINSLLEIRLEDERYAETAVLIFGLFNTWFFLAGIPDDITALQQKQDYPKGLKVFAQYILLPLVLLYLGILYCYVFKITAAGTWPKGIIAYLILGVSVTGILALLLLHPLTIADKNSWVAKASKIYYILLIPLSIVLALAVWRRVSEYHLTENRYLLVLLTLWLFAMTLYFVFSKVKNIKIIPISLFIFTLIAAIMPYFNAFNMARWQQVNRFTTILEENGLIKDGKINKLTEDEKLPKPVVNEIRNIADYLSNRDYLMDLDDLFEENLAEALSSSRYNKHRELMDLMGIEESKAYYSQSSAFHSRYAQHRDLIEISGYDIWLPLNIHFPKERKANFNKAFYINEQQYLLMLDKNNEHLLLQKNDSTLLSIPINQYFNTIEATAISNDHRSSLSPEQMTFTETQNGMKSKLLVKNIEVGSIPKPKAEQKKDGKNYTLYLRRLNATLLIGRL